MDAAGYIVVSREDCFLIDVAVKPGTDPGYFKREGAREHFLCSYSFSYFRLFPNFFFVPRYDKILHAYWLQKYVGTQSIYRAPPFLR